MVHEVRYERLHPREIRKAREDFPAVYIPLGTLEWHGHHNPVGLDALKIHRLCMCCAQTGGGLVFPPLYYGEPREEGLMDSNPNTTQAIAHEMGLPPANFEPGRFRRTPAEVVSSYQVLLLHILNQAASLGFRVLVLGAGHYPLLDHARAAALVFHQQRRFGNRYEHPPIVWAFTGYELVRDSYPDAGDHAGYWETSLLMALEPELVDLSALPPESEDSLVGVFTKRPVRESTRRFGEEAVTKIVERVTAAVRDRIENPEKYRGHGLALGT